MNYAQQREKWLAEHPTQPFEKHGTTATSQAPKTGADREDDHEREWDEWDDPEEDDIDYSGLDPAFSSWEEVNGMFFTI